MIAPLLRHTRCCRGSGSACRLASGRGNLGGDGWGESEAVGGAGSEGSGCFGLV